jgi:arsenate reductase (thioredoxin)
MEKIERSVKFEERPCVLILCTGNSARSQMAEGLLRSLSRDKIEVFSAGVNPSEVRPEAIEVMGEIGIDITSHWSKSVTELGRSKFDYVITVCDHAREVCPVIPGEAILIHQSFEDPPQPGRESPEQTRAVFRRVRDEIRVWIDGFARRVLNEEAPLD